MDSRRLVGPNLFAHGEGAVLDVTFPESDGAALLLAWRTVARLFAERLGWSPVSTIVRRHPGGAQCFLGVPIDALLAATEVNERAWAAAEAIVAGRAAPDLHDALARLRVHALHERTPRLVALQRAAAAHGVTFTFDDEHVSVGAGHGSATWTRGALPLADDVDWSAVHDIPVVLVTGSNGKTTTTRLLAAMLTEAGYAAGYTSTDGVWCAGTEVDHGDYSGPIGARLVLRDRRVGAAVLETARGGMLRRGLATTRANAAIVTRIAADHFGEYGIHDLVALGDAKLLVERALIDGGALILNADDATLVTLAPSRHAPITWFSLDAASPVVAAHRQRGGNACVLDGTALHYLTGDSDTSLGDVSHMPLTLGGAARYNVSNALAAAAAAMALRLPPDAIRHALRRFGADPHDNPGRLTLLQYRDARVVVDFAHNPDGWRALFEALRGVKARRRIVLVGQGGDREDDALDALAAAVWSEHPDIVILKELPKYLRGRAPGEVTARLASAFRALGAPDDSVCLVDGEEAGIRLALAECAPGDLLVLSVHDDYDRAMRLLADAGATAITAAG